MPKKRKKDRKAPSRRSSVQTTPAQRAVLELVDWNDASEEGVDVIDAFTERFPTPVDAVKAVQAGECVQWTGGIDGSTMRHRVLLFDDGTATVEQAVFVGGPLEELLLCAWHQAGEQRRDSLEAGVLAALGELHTAIRPVLEAEIRKVRPDYTAAVPQPFREDPELYGPGMPVFGWRILHPVGPDTTWEDTRDTAAWNTSETMSGLLGYYDHVPELQQAGLAAVLRKHDVPVVLCVDCGQPITDRHPRWMSVWVTPDSEHGPVCGYPRAARVTAKPALGTFTDHDFGGPHHPA
ncbi:hypothetical protein [Streptomyces drozdowiczii]|uniref:Uncharacterized protein n=1 Tax=Streptomyces drozdowiczii TaxID=202862 RepID=A0ABY6Q1V5_9ACTN|nr:hypothetical protein [Streptomyces drozdowiczii]MCX0241828.1 hypothetical protein [Streptomyces drozdowiczii]UZK58329.1 hypothetical protein NEH16_33405 [Streptomyces drozdowiczii]